MKWLAAYHLQPPQWISAPPSRVRQVAPRESTSPLTCLSHWVAPAFRSKLGLLSSSVRRSLAGILSLSTEHCSSAPCTAQNAPRSRSRWDGHGRETREPCPLVWWQWPRSSPKPSFGMLPLSGMLGRCSRSANQTVWPSWAGRKILTLQWPYIYKMHNPGEASGSHQAQHSKQVTERMSCYKMEGTKLSIRNSGKPWSWA